MVYFGGVFLACYLAATLAAFAVLRQVGYPIGYTSFLLPTRWSDIRRAQEAVYAARAERELAAGNFSAAILALEVVHLRNPRNEAAALSLAQLWQISGRPHLADAVLARTIAAVPESRTAMARNWYRMLLARGGFTHIKLMTLDQLVHDTPQRVPWLNALLFACRQTKDPAPLAKLAETTPAVPEWCLEIAVTERTIIAGDLTEARARLLRMAARPASNFVPYYHADRLLSLGFNHETLLLLEQHAALFSPNEAAAFRLRAYAQLGWLPSQQAEYNSLLEQLATPPVPTLLAAHLLRFPDAGRAGSLARRLTRVHSEATTESYPVIAAAFLACQRSGAEAAAADLLRILQRNTATRARTLETFGAMLAGTRREQIRLDLMLPAIVLPIEITYTLLELHPPPAR